MAVSELPGNPNAVWTVKTNAAGYLSLSAYNILWNISRKFGDFSKVLLKLNCAHF